MEMEFLRKKYESKKQYLLEKIAEPRSYSPLIREGLHGQLHEVKGILHTLDALEGFPGAKLEDWK